MKNSIAISIENIHKLVESGEYGRILPNIGPMQAMLRTISGDGIGRRIRQADGKYTICPLPNPVTITSQFMHDMHNGLVVPLTLDKNCDDQLYHSPFLRDFLQVSIVQGSTKIRWGDIEWGNDEKPPELTLVFRFRLKYSVSMLDNDISNYDAVYAKFAYSHGFVSTFEIQDSGIPYKVYVSKVAFPSDYDFNLEFNGTCFACIQRVSRWLYKPIYIDFDDESMCSFIYNS